MNKKHFYVLQFPQLTFICFIPTPVHHRNAGMGWCISGSAAGRVGTMWKVAVLMLVEV